MSDPLVTVAMSVYNSAATIELAIRSIQSQTLKNWELIVIDDGSTDRTGERISCIKDSRVRFIQAPVGNLGLASRLNQCVSLARGRYIARMDADDVAYPQRLERQVQFLQEHPDIDLLGAGAILFTGAGDVIGRYPTASSHEAICRTPWWGFPLAHPTWMGKQDWFTAHLYSDQDVRCEDQVLLLRSFAHSRFAALQEILLGYRVTRISAGKLGRGRFCYCRRLFDRVQDPTSLSWAILGLGIHGIAFARDLILQAGRIVGKRSRRSWVAANQAEREQWYSVWATLIHEQALSCTPNT